MYDWKSGCWSERCSCNWRRGATLVGALEALLAQKWAANVVNGQTVLTTAEAGGSVTFTFDRAYTPAELAVMAEEAQE